MVKQKKKTQLFPFCLHYKYFFWSHKCIRPYLSRPVLTLPKNPRGTEVLAGLLFLFWVVSISDLLSFSCFVDLGVSLLLGLATREGGRRPPGFQ